MTKINHFKKPLYYFLLLFFLYSVTSMIRAPPRAIDLKMILHCG